MTKQIGFISRESIRNVNVIPVFSQEQIVIILTESSKHIKLNPDRDVFYLLRSFLRKTTVNVVAPVETNSERNTPVAWSCCIGIIVFFLANELFFILSQTSSSHNLIVFTSCSLWNHIVKLYGCLNLVNHLLQVVVWTDPVH